MGAGIIRVAKVKAADIGGLQKHMNREGESHTNPDIDEGRRTLNQSWVDNGNYRDFITRRIAEGRTSARAVRKDAVVMVDGMVTMPYGDYERMGEDMAMAYLRDAKAFVGEFFGEENLVFFTIHRDETVPHAHFGAVPLKDGSLSWKKFFDGRDSLRAFQDAFYDRVSSRYGLERGNVRQKGEPVRRHEPMAAFKARTEKELDALDRERAKAAVDVAKLYVQRDRLDEEVQRLVADAEKAKKEAAAEAERLERLRCDCAARENEIADTRAAAFEVQEQARDAAAGVVEDGGRIFGLKGRLQGLGAALSRLRGRVAALRRNAPQKAPESLSAIKARVRGGYMPPGHGGIQRPGRA